MEVCNDSSDSRRDGNEEDDKLFAIMNSSTLTERNILDFRLSSSLFSRFYQQFATLITTLMESSSPSSPSPSSIINIQTQLLSYLKFLQFCCHDYDFSYQFGDYGGHFLIKRILQQTSLSSCDHENIYDECYELISIITSNGCSYPMTRNVLHKEQIMRPLIYQFTQYYEDDMRTLIHVILRQIPISMHGEGQIAVGYIIWSAALILSRWISYHAQFFQQKLVLEIGAGTGLCGIVACACGASVVISDYTDMILKNIDQNIRLNLNEGYVENTMGCLDSLSRAKVYHLDWNTLNSEEEIIIDAVEKCKISSSYPSLSPSQPTTFHDPSSSPDFTYDIIIASDMVCCDSDAIGVTNTLLYFLRPKGIAFFAVPNPYHRYGVAKLIPTLQQHFHVFLRPISHSSFAAQHHSSFDSEVLTEEIKSQLDAHQLYLIETLLEPSNQFLNDQLTHDLPEKEYFEWLLVIVIRRRTENRAKES